MHLVYLTFAVNILLTGILVWFLKPYAAGYATEKSKHLARREDIDDVLHEVRLVAETQKRIEREFAGDLWSKQTVWAEKKRTYSALIDSLFAFIRELSLVANKFPPEELPTITSDPGNEHVRPLTDAWLSLSNNSAGAFIFLYKPAVDELDEFLGMLNKNPPPMQYLQMCQIANHTEAFLQTIIQHARTELHVSTI